VSARAPNRRRRVLFISHHNARTGAALVLLVLVRWVRANTDIEPIILVRNQGALLEDFAALGRVVWCPRLRRIPRTVMKRVFGEPAVRQREDRSLRRLVRRLAPDLIYSNTITNVRELRALAGLNLPSICHVYELEYYVRQIVGLDALAPALAATSRFVVWGSAVRNLLVETLGVPPERIDVTQAFPIADSEPAAPVDRAAFRRELGIPDDVFVVGACGTIDWRKGTDLFLAVAEAAAKAGSSRPLRFVWLGASMDPNFKHQIEFDLKRTAASASVIFAGPRKDPVPFFTAIDAFLITSREDSGPIVMLEAAAHGAPIIGFTETGGPTDFVAGDAGRVVPYLDVGAMARAVVELAAQPAIGARWAANARSKLATVHATPVQLPALFDAMCNTVPALRASRRAPSAASAAPRLTPSPLSQQ
jgi:glycosyltransferase involved in cell wall biosynthesis